MLLDVATTSRRGTVGLVKEGTTISEKVKVCLMVCVLIASIIQLI